MILLWGKSLILYKKMCVGVISSTPLHFSPPVVQECHVIQSWSFIIVMVTGGSKVYIINVYRLYSESVWSVSSLSLSAFEHEKKWLFGFGKGGGALLWEAKSVICGKAPHSNTAESFFLYYKSVDWLFFSPWMIWKGYWGHKMYRKITEVLDYKVYFPPCCCTLHFVELRNWELEVWK